MGNSNLKTGVALLVGLILGLFFGLFWAWRVSPVTYKGGAYPAELSQNYQLTYAQSVAEAYIVSRNVENAELRLRSFNATTQVKLLAEVEKGYSGQGLPQEAAIVTELAKMLQTRNNWAEREVANGLLAGKASNEFAAQLSQAPPPVDNGQPAQPTVESSQPQPTPAAAEPAPSSGRSMGYYFGIFLLVAAVVVIVLFLLTRIKTDSQSLKKKAPDVADIVTDEGVTLKPIRQWSTVYQIGQDNFDESFAVETPDNDFLGEGGMGILEGFASGSPKRVAAFDVWVFDKTDIRTLSTPLLSQFAYDDEILREKAGGDQNPVLAESGQEFSIETNALRIVVKIDDVEYGEEAPPNSYFNSIKITMTAFLRPDIDTSSMPLPDSMK